MVDNHIQYLSMLSKLVSGNPLIKNEKIINIENIIAEMTFVLNRIFEENNVIIAAANSDVRENASNSPSIINIIWKFFE